MGRREEFEAQLRRDDERTANELLTNPEKESILKFYEAHFDEIKQLVANCRSLRNVIEDFYAIEPSMRQQLSDDHLFVYMVNVAVQKGVLTRESFSTDY